MAIDFFTSASLFASTSFSMSNDPYMSVDFIIFSLSTSTLILIITKCFHIKNLFISIDNTTVIKIRKSTI